jgi:hypothetical protein
MNAPKLAYKFSEGWDLKVTCDLRQCQEGLPKLGNIPEGPCSCQATVEGERGVLNLWCWKTCLVHWNLHVDASVPPPHQATWLPCLASPSARTHLNSRSLSLLPPRPPLMFIFAGPYLCEVLQRKGGRVSRYDSAGPCASPRRHSIPGCGFQISHLLISNRWQRPYQKDEIRVLVSHIRKGLGYHLLLEVYWGEGLGSSNELQRPVGQNSHPKFTQELVTESFIWCIISHMLLSLGGTGRCWWKAVGFGADWAFTVSNGLLSPADVAWTTLWGEWGSVDNF